ncbi:MAG: hypothetical protein IKU11_02080 [Clostridia bacterium]|nr:hypothetical protein [Clostridia bacterium]
MEVHVHILEPRPGAALKVFPRKAEEQIPRGGDYLTARIFLEALEEGRQPEHPYNLRAAIAMSSVAILAHRSMLEGGNPYDIPDFTREEDRKLYENDCLSPFYYTDGTAPTLPTCSVTDFAPTEEQMTLLRKLVMEEE